MKRTFNLLVLVTLLALTFGAVGVAPAKAAGPLNVLFIDDDRGLTVETTWLSTLSALGITYSYEAIAANGNPASNLSSYNVVIWSIADCAYSNLTAANVATLTAYLNGGGNLLYAGGHSVYEEPTASSFIQNYLGLSNFTYSMPMFQNNGLPVFADGTGNPITLNNLYSLNTFPGGCYGGTMFSSFTPGLSTAQSTLSPRSTNLSLAGIPNEAIAVFNDAPSYNTATWGFDLNNLDPQFRNQLLRDTLLALNGTYDGRPDITNLRSRVVAANLTDTRVRTSLLAPLDAALVWLNGSDPNKVAYSCSNLAKFIATVRQNISFGKLPAATGNPWIVAANDILALSGCPTR